MEASQASEDSVLMEQHSHAVSHLSGSAGMAWLGIWLLLSALVALYWAGVSQLRRRGRSWSAWRTAGFLFGIGWIVFSVSPPLTHWAHQDLRGHMVQHLLIGMLAPIAIVLAAPLTLALRTLPARTARRLGSLLRHPILRFMSHPFTSGVLNIGGMYLLYATPLYAMALSHAAIHHLVHFHFFAAGYLFCWAIAGPDAVPRRPGMRVRLTVLFLAMASHAILGKLMYAHHWPQGTHHSAEEIEAAAQLMYYGGDFAEVLLAIALFAAWYRAGSRRLRARAAQAA